MGINNVPALATDKFDLEMVRKTLTFTGITTSPQTVFTVTGAVYLRFALGHCTEDIAAGTPPDLSFGTATNTALFVPTTTATDIDSGEIWLDGTPATSKALASADFIGWGISEDLILTLSGGVISFTAGIMEMVVMWAPLTFDGSVKQA